MESHQKYFCVFDANGQLSSHFIGIANLTDINQSLKVVITGNERVIYPRLADTQFFYQQDIAHSLASRLDQLKTVIFMQDLGNLFDKATRLEKLAQYLADTLNLTTKEKTCLVRASLLSKCDLLTNMVIELPKLQGIMGGYYAQVDDETPEVAQAISQHYYPRFSGDNLPETSLSCYLSLLDKIDTISGVFAIGKIPTGSKDPYALRRLAVGVVRIIIEQSLRINLDKLITYAFSLHQVTTKKENEILLIPFILERLKAYYLEQYTTMNTAILNAVSLNKEASLLDYHQKIIALIAFSKQAEAKNLITLNKRLVNTLKDSQVTQFSTIDQSLLTHPTELVLLKNLMEIEAKKYNDYEHKILDLCTLEVDIANFFDQVLINDKNKVLRQNRLNLLNTIRLLLLSVADLSQL